MLVAKYIAGLLEKEGIHAETFESAPGRGFLVARMNASAVPDPSKALLLMAHMDVVGADKSEMDRRSLRRHNAGRLHLRPRHD